MTRRRGLFVSIALAASALALPSVALAQLGLGQPGGGYGQPGGFAPPTPGGKKPKQPKKDPNAPETHAAPSPDDDSHIQTTEPTLPADPTAIPPAVAKRIGTDDQTEPEVGKGTKVERNFYGPYYSEYSGQYSFRTLFPFWAERRMADPRATTPGATDRASLYGLYFNRRSSLLDQDILFPFFWNLRNDVARTTIVGPFVHAESSPKGKEPGSHDNWLAPFVFEGAKSDGSGYFHLPLLATFTQHTASSGFNLAGPLYCKWKGGPTCDARTTDSIDLGVAPFYFYGRDENTEYEIVPPLLHYYRYSDVGDSSTNVWGPVMTQHSRESDVLNVMPLFWHNWGKNEDHLTVFPFFHYGYKGPSNLLVTPLFLNATGEHGESTFATWGYAHYKGRTELSMYSPLLWHYQDPDVGLNRWLAFPFVYSNESRRSHDLALFPLFADFKKPGISETMFVTPFFRHTTDTTGWETDILPFFWLGRQYNSTHLVAAPFLWDFATPHSRTTMVLPAFYRFADDNVVTQVALNTYYREKKVQGGTEWEVHVFPLFSAGASPTGHWWNVLYGLAGYTREGTSAKMRALYVPIPLSN